MEVGCVFFLCVRLACLGVRVTVCAPADNKTPAGFGGLMRFIVGDRVRTLDDLMDNGAPVAPMGGHGTVEYVDNDGIDGTQHGVTVRFDASGRALTVSPDDLRASFVHTARLVEMLREGGVLVRGEHDRFDGSPDYGVWYGDHVYWEHGEARMPDSDRVGARWESGRITETEQGTTFAVVAVDARASVWPGAYPDRFR